MRTAKLVAVLLTLIALPVVAAAQTDGRDAVFRDDLLDNLVGTWTVVGQVRGENVRNTLEARWVLNHQFLQLTLKDVAQPPQYEAWIVIGYNRGEQRFVAHWLDVFGGRASETLGFGRRDGDTLVLTFDYPDGTFRDTLTWLPVERAWRFRLETRDQQGRWTTFASYRLTREAR